MRFENFGNTNKLVPLIGQGTYGMPLKRGTLWEEAKLAIRTGIEYGMVHIDTAEMYGDGLAEEFIADAIHNIPREQLFIVSKMLPQNASYKGTTRACEESLKRLHCEYLDCYLLHWRDSNLLSETMHGLETLVKQGKILSLGVSNFDVADLTEAESYLSHEKIACNQVLYNLFARGIERKLIPYCQKKAIAIVGYTPFARKSIPLSDLTANNTLVQIAEKYGTTTKQVILSFLTRDRGVFTIPKAAKHEHAIENASAGDLILDKTDISQLDLAFPAPAQDVPLEML